MEVTGPVARVEPVESHRTFLREVGPDWAAIQLHHAEHLVDRGHTGASWAGSDTNFIVTTTIPDERLDEYRWAEQRDIIKEFAPEACVPADVSVFPDQPKSERVSLIKNCMEGAAFLQAELSPHGIATIPLFKGVTSGERNICLDAAGALGVEQVAIYVTRFFTAGFGNNRTRLFRYLRWVDQQHEMPSALLLGLLSPSYLESVPSWVNGAAGLNQWRERISVESQSAKEMRNEYHALVSGVESALSLQQSGTKVEEDERPVASNEPVSTLHGDD